MAICPDCGQDDELTDECVAGVSLTDAGAVLAAALEAVAAEEEQL